MPEHPCDKRGYRVTSAGGSWRGRLLRATPWGWHSRRHLSVPCRGGAGVRPSPEATEAEPRSSRAVAQRCPKVWECMSHVLKSGDRREAPDFSFPFLKKRRGNAGPSRPRGRRGPDPAAASEARHRAPRSTALVVMLCGQGQCVHGGPTLICAHGTFLRKFSYVQISAEMNRQTPACVPPGFSRSRLLCLP